MGYIERHLIKCGSHRQLVNCSYEYAWLRTLVWVATAVLRQRLGLFSPALAGLLFTRMYSPFVTRASIAVARLVGTELPDR
jgi:hypothetical protein